MAVALSAPAIIAIGTTAREELRRSSSIARSAFISSKVPV
jgi:hypothetical protein